MPGRSYDPITIDWQIKSTTISDVHLLCHQGDQPDQPRCGLRYRIFAPRAVKKEEHDFGSIERQAFVWSKLDAKVLGQRSPTALAIELRHPVDIGNVGRESVAESDKHMVGV